MATFSCCCHPIQCQKRCRRLRKSCSEHRQCRDRQIIREQFRPGPSIAPIEDFAKANKNRNTSYLRSTRHMLDALEVQVPALIGLRTEAFWNSGQKILDVGCGSGEMAKYLAIKYNLSAHGLDVKPPEKNRYAAGSGHKYFLRICLKTIFFHYKKFKTKRTKRTFVCR